MIQEGEIAGRVILLAGEPGTGKTAIAMGIINLFMFIWTQLGILLVMKTSRNAEFKADRFAYDLGYGEGLLSAFYSFLEIEDYIEKPGLFDRLDVFAALSSSHPKTKKRIDKLIKYANEDVA